MMSRLIEKIGGLNNQLHERLRDIESVNPVMRVVIGEETPKKGKETKDGER